MKFEIIDKPKGAKKKNKQQPAAAKEVELQVPKAEEAKNELIRKLLTNNDIEKSCPARTKNHGIRIIGVINAS